MLRFRVHLLAIILGLIPMITDAVADRAIPEDNLAYPVLISLNGADIGSGFYLLGNNSLYLVTAKHVLFDPETKKLRQGLITALSYSKDQADAHSEGAVIHYFTDLRIFRVLPMPHTNSPRSGSRWRSVALH